MTWWELLLDALGANRYSAHSLCLTNDQLIMTVFVAAHLTIFAAYMAIGWALLLNRKLIMTASAAAIGMYGAFIVACGATHFSSVITLWAGVYRLEVAILAATAAISGVTAVYTTQAVFAARGA